ncbi:hypothetical protein RUM43_010769 [Polyplax serrata]|uniref:Uncharacterized protein n=1 Tax=Polyplax serrata TaxID=468196 RepID=A0AAN8PLR5_POLSC
MENANLSESVEELRMKLEAMKRLIENTEGDEEKGRSRRRPICKDSIIDGSFLSFVFIIVLLLIICVSIYAFSNLYYAVLKKYPGKKHTEL